MTDGRPARTPVFARLSERQWFALCAIATCLGIAVLVLITNDHPRERGQRLFVAMLACGPVFALRRWPLPALGFATAAVGLEIVMNTVSLPFGVVLGLAAFLVSSTFRRRTWIRIAAVIGLVLVAALGYAISKYPSGAANEAVLGLLPFAAGLVIGDNVAARRRYLAGPPSRPNVSVPPRPNEPVRTSGRSGSASPGSCMTWSRTRSR